MARRPNLSIHLPPDFDFSSPRPSLPMTPDQPQELQLAAEPPPPPRQKYTIKRRRPEMVAFEPILLSDTAPDAVIPTIEMSESLSESSSPLLQSQLPNSELLSPLPIFQRLATPKTPMPQTHSANQLDSPSHEWDLINDSRDSKQPLHRANSVCSSFSDSSVSSGGSSGFSAPNGCTSPESVATDPFVEDDMSKADKLLLSPAMRSSSPSAKRVKRHRHVRWTPEMDQHLENTYIRYLSDPRVTPFKTLPGVPPPLGVCNRVAVKARHTWSQHRAATPSSLDTIMEAEKSQREGSPDTIRPDTSSASSSAFSKQPQWPRSDGATRKRLRKIVKGKPQLSAHYQRLLRTRSPSPFTSTSSTNRSSVEPPSAPASASASASASAFSSRDLKLSLITSTAPSMQPEGPLAQLATEDTTPQPQRPAHRHSQSVSRPVDWFARIGRSQAHQKSLSLQSGLSLNTSICQTSAPLASPFDESATRNHLLQSMNATQSLGRSDFSNKNGKRPSLDSPFEMQGAPTMPRSLKRRFKSDEEKPRRPVLASVFTAPSDEGGIVRNRGFTVGAVRATDNLTRLFDPPPPLPQVTLNASPAVPQQAADQEMTEASSSSSSNVEQHFTPDASSSSLSSPSLLGPIGTRSAPRRLAEPIPRLGSPFMEMSSGAGATGQRQFNTFPRSYLPTMGNPQPFAQRIRELAGGDLVAMLDADVEDAQGRGGDDVF